MSINNAVADLGKKLYLKLIKEKELKNYLKNMFKSNYDSIIEAFLRTLANFNLLKPFSKLYKPIKANKPIVCYGAVRGLSYRGNPKYLFLYAIKNKNTYDYWFTRSRKVYDTLKKSGLPVVFSYSFKAIKILRSAHTVFCDNGFRVDFLPIFFSPKSLLVQTWHGRILFKTIKAGFIFTKMSHISNMAWKDIIVSGMEKCSYIISPAKFTNPWILHGFDVKPEQILNTGYPRDDIFFEDTQELQLITRKICKIPKKSKRLILFAPTHRPPWMKSKFPFTESELKKLDDYLEETNSLLLFKDHFLGSLSAFNNMRNSLRINTIIDTQELLLICDVLITDYSSIYFSFILFNKPIILFAYDWYEYCYERGSYVKYEDLKDYAFGSIPKTGTELIEKIKNIDIWFPKAKDKMNKIKDRFYDHQDGKSSKRIFGYLNL